MLEWLKSRLASYQEGEREETWSFDPSWERSGPTRELSVAVHAARSERIVVMLPGWNGSLDGYEQKYAKLARFLAERGVGAVVRSGKPTIPGFPFETTCKTVLRGVVEGALSRAKAICGSRSPSILLMGWSAGASAAAAIAADLPRVEAMLLFAPSGDAGDAAVVAGLERYRSQLFVVAAADDEVVGDLPRELFGYAEQASRKEFVSLPNCDHQFKGETNGRIMSQAPLWAFAGAEGFPDPSQGISLYR